MLDEWDKDENNDLAPLKPVVEREQVQHLLPSHFLPLVAILVDWLPEWYTEEDEEEPPVPRWWVDEQAWIWPPLSNSEGRRTGFEQVSCVFLYTVL